MPDEPKIIRREYLRLWRLAFPKKWALKCARYFATAAGKAARSRAQFQYNHSPLRVLAQSRYAASPKGRVNYNAKEGRRRAAKRGAELQNCAQIYNKAILWRKLGFDVVVDHIIPLVKGGAHAPENLQIIYREDNLRKGTKLSYVPAAIFS